MWKLDGAAETKRRATRPPLLVRQARSSWFKMFACRKSAASCRRQRAGGPFHPEISALLAGRQLHCLFANEQNRPGIDGLC
jgi:hypothetical protein